MTSGECTALSSVPDNASMVGRRASRVLAEDELGEESLLAVAMGRTSWDVLPV